MIAMAMSCHPALLIADEPTTALDVTVQKNILELMKRLQQKYGMSIIFISHDLGVIAEIADTVIVMYRGNVVEQGLVADIFKDPQQGYTKGLLACRPKLDVRLRSLPTVEQFLQDRSEGSNEIVGEAERKAIHEVLYSQAPMLDVDHIKTYFPLHTGLFSLKPKNFKAVDDVSLKLFPGETLGLVGESGCGKTTLGRTIIKLIEPTDGKIIFLGKDISGYSRRKMRDLRKDIQIIFQDPYSSLNPRITVGKAIVEAMRMHKIGESAKGKKKPDLCLIKRGEPRRDLFQPLSTRIVGRAAPENLYCPCPGTETQICDLRRIRFGPRCFGAGTGAQSAQPSEEGVSVFHDLYFSRHVGCEIYGRPHDGNEKRKNSGIWRPRRYLSGSVNRLYPSAPQFYSERIVILLAFIFQNNPLYDLGEITIFQFVNFRGKAFRRI